MTNVTGIVRIDLGVYADRGYVHVGDRVVSEVFPVLAKVDDADAVSLDIGDAVFVSWDERIVALLCDAVSVHVSGSNPDGVRQAVRDLRRAIEALGGRAA